MVSTTGFLASHRRWLVVVLLMGFGVVNYLDRQALSVLAPVLRQELGFTTVQYSYIVALFLTSYAIGYAFSGALLDRVGVKLALGAALVFWSIAGMGHALAAGWVTLAVWRFLLGLGQSFNGPGAIKALSEWIPRRERGLCTALVSNSNSLGAVLAPPIVGGLALAFGWRWTFVIVGALGLPLLVAWWRLYYAVERHPRLEPSERELVLQERGAAGSPNAARSTSYGELLRDNRCLGFFLGRMLTDPAAYFLAFWLPDYFQTQRGFSLSLMAVVGWIPYLASPLFGGPLGGALSDWLVRRGLSTPVARRRLMLAAACVMPVALIAVRTDHVWLAIALIFLMVAANSCWTVNLLTLASEVAPAGRVGTLVALGGMGGSIGGIVSTLLAGKLIATVGYVPVFTGLGFIYLAAFFIIRRALRSVALPS